jgi:hypothetical protein
MGIGVNPLKCSQNLVKYCGMSAEIRTVKTAEQPLLGNGFVNTPVAKQWFRSRHVLAPTNTHATRGELLEAVFSMRPVPSHEQERGEILYKVTGVSYT